MRLVHETIKLPRNPYGVITPLRYPGGKSAMAGLLSELIQSIDFNRRITYIEPYAGGAGSAVLLLLNGIVDRIIINDFDVAVYAFWHSILYRTEEFIDLINAREITIDEWEKQREIYKAKNTEDLLSLGFSFFFLNRTNHSGIVSGGGPIGGYCQDGDYSIDARFNKTALVTKIKQIAERKERVRLLNRDGKSVFAEYADRKNTFFYMDPPYVKQGKNLYFNALVKRDHKNLAEVANNHKDAKWLITYDCETVISDMYPERDQYSYHLRYTAHKKREATELMICSDVIRQYIKRHCINQYYPK
jgi:DNA adenine methylase